MAISLIISGGQSGADLGGLKAGIRLNIPTGGFMPKDWRTEDGQKPEYETLYGMSEYQSEDYIGRTRQNVKIGDATVIFGRRSVGSNRTEEFCRVMRKPCMWVNVTNMGFRKANINAFRLWIVRYEIETLNVAGNRESVSPGICDFVEAFLVEALK